MTTAATEMPGQAWVEYARRPSAFIHDAFGITLDEWQAEAIDALPEERRVAVRSGHGVGKTTDLSCTVIWGLVVAGAVVPCTAPTQSQLQTILWPEIGRIVQRNPMIARELEITDRRIRLRRDPNIFAVARVAKTREGLAGFHHPRLIYVIDEAPGVPEELMQVVEGALTTEDARCFMAGNPTKPTGYFVDAFGRHSERWHGITVNCEDSPRVARAWVSEMEETWGRDSDVYRVRVLGLPPQGEAKGFISPRLVDDAVARWRQIEGDGPLILGLDVARYGADKSAIAARRGYKVTELRARHGLSNPQCAAWAADVVRELSTPGERAIVRVDDGGVGGGVTDILLTMVMEGTLDAEVAGMNFGGKGDRHYATNAGVWYGTIRRLAQQELLGLPADEELKQQLTTRTFQSNQAGKIVLEPKDHMRDRGVPSPDKADAVALAFAGTSLDDWDSAYGVRACDGCGHRFVDPGHERTCPQCGARP